MKEAAPGMYWVRPSTVTIQDFQSLDDVTFSLGAREGGGGLTTVVGPSSTGKSAVVRALRLLCENSTVPAVRAGASKTIISVEDQDGTVVEISRGPSHSVYRVTTPEGLEERYPKAGRSVPPEVAAILNLAEDVHFASQFDPPYLLADSGSRVSAVIGAFTHAEEMQAAAREGNRRRLRASQERELRVQDMKETARKIKELDPEKLKADRAKVDEQKEALAVAQRLNSELEEVRRLVGVLEALAEGEAKARPALEILERRAGVDLSRVEALLEEHALLMKFEDLDQNYVRIARENVAQQQEVVEHAERELAALEAEIEVCPTCGRPL